MEVKVKRLHPKAVLPTLGTEYAAGADLYSVETVTVAAGQTEFIHMGWAMEIPVGYAGFVFARSGLAAKRDLAPANKVGVVDSDYRGEIMVAIHNHGQKDQTVEAGERVAQMVIMPYLAAQYIEVDELSDTKRGTGGFGSTGSK